MIKTKIESVEIHAEKFVLTCKPYGDNWECNIPTNMKNGKYDVQIIATSETQKQSSWSGTLFMNTDGVKLKINQAEFSLRATKPKNKIQLLPCRYILKLERS